MKKIYFPVKIKILPDFGDAYIIILPDSVKTSDEINAWLDANINFVQAWEYVDKNNHP